MMNKINIMYYNFIILNELMNIGFVTNLLYDNVSRFMLIALKYNFDYEKEYYYGKVTQ